TGSVIQNVVESKDGKTTKEDEKTEVVELKEVPKGHWSEEAINYLAKEKIFIGYGNGEYGFGDNITSGQVALQIQSY
ncbi:S-layer homology domain-containing protein, partial [Bacillus cereus]|nr:S-layer homology domain-containing protein [Bacillus cereus]